MLLEKERVATFDDPHDEDKEFLARQTKAGKMYDYFYAKIDDPPDESFDIQNISDFSDEETVGSGQYDSNVQEVVDTSAADVVMIDVDTSDPLNSQSKIPRQDPQTEMGDTNQANSSMPSLGLHQITTPTKLSSSISRPSSWDSDEDDPIFELPLATQPKWTTTPVRSKQKQAAVSAATRNRHRSSAKNLFKQAFPSAANRFSALSEEQRPVEQGVITQNMELKPHVFNEEEDQSYTESAEGQDLSDEESLDNMSLVSSTELQDLEDYAKSEDGYETDTTDNTSPSHKKAKLNTRKSGEKAKVRISEFYTASNALMDNLWDGDDNNSVVSPISLPVSTSSHPSLNTTSPSEGHGAEST